MYILTSIICSMQANGIEIKSEAALKDTLTVAKLIFTPINAMIVLSSIGNLFGKIKDKDIETDKAGKRMIIIAVAFVIVLIFESCYIGNFIRELLG